MATSDKFIWSILDKQFCSYKTEAMDEKKFCKHPMNVIGICKMAYCPLANSQYATVVEKNGKIFLCMKTAERAHLPSKMWEKVILNFDKEQAFAQIDRSMRFWDVRQKNRCKARFIKIMLMLRRMRKIRQEGTRATMVTVKKKEERRLTAREKKAEKIAMLEHKIGDELLGRLRKGVYGNLYKTQEDREKEKQSEPQEEVEEEIEFEEDYDEEDDFDINDEDLAEFEFEDDAEEDIEDIYTELEDEFDRLRKEEPNPKKRSRGDDNTSNAKKPRRRKHLELEYEDNQTSDRQFA